jgi:hypothetical protein
MPSSAAAQPELLPRPAPPRAPPQQGPAKKTKKSEKRKKQGPAKKTNSKKGKKRPAADANQPTIMGWLLPVVMATGPAEVGRGLSPPSNPTAAWFGSSNPGC